jgi:ferrous iron transport protein B
VTAAARPPVVALIGRPNSGKSSLFNRLTGGSAHVGNFPGVTVEILEASVVLPGGEAAQLVDLPGLYTLDARLDVASDERIARDFLARRREAGDRVIVVQVVDAAQLGLGLRLTRDLAVQEPELPLILVATQADALAAEGRGLDVAALSAALGVPVVLTSAREPAARGAVLAEVERALASGAEAPRPCPEFSPDELAARVTTQAEPRLAGRAARARTERIDAVLLHPLLGPLLFVAIMGGLFASVFLIADPATQLCDMATQRLGAWLRPVLGGELGASLVVDGALGGVGTVLAFLPQIVLLVAALDLLEASGYLARAAFLVDRLFRAYGLGGKAFVPLLTAHACAVPAIAATRVLREPRERLTAMLVIPLMTCSARLPVYTLVVAAFFGGGAGRKALICTGLYVAGLASGLLVAVVLRRTVTRGRSLPLALEMPAYRAPMLRATLARCRREAASFVRQAGTVILAASVVLWALLSVPVRGDATGAEPVIERSAAAALGRALEPVTRPLGFDWRLNVGLIGSFGARELMVGTLGVIFGIEKADEEPQPLVEKIKAARGPDGRPAYSTATAAALLAFFVLACQCISTLSAIRRETRSWRWPAFVLVYTYGLAYVVAAVVYQIVRAIS